ncbi:unnamed protein product, partial [Brassica rapa]
IDSYRFRSPSNRSTASETDHHQFGSLIHRLSRKYRSLSFDTGLRLIASLSGSQTCGSPTRLVMSTSALNTDRKNVTGPTGYVLEDVPHFSELITSQTLLHIQIHYKTTLLTLLLSK